ncbi:MAG: D-alanyl-D-alanine carboxypeptidase [Candidatus Liptonbacteria bacterium]|nr:D-alanyl-D-alanine carboxypeptidase [Candidatus Liptonbacteria bacterium]
MKNNFPKFLLVGVMVFVTVVLGNSKTKSQEVIAKKEPPKPEIKLESASVTNNLIITTSSDFTSLIDESSTSNVSEAIPNQAVQSKSNIDPAQAKSEQTKFSFFKTQELDPPEIKVQAATVFDLQTDTAYFELGGETRWPMASLTKLMTAALTIKNIDLNQKVSLEAKDFEFPEGNGAELKVGEVFTADDLLKVMLGTSSNEAAEALAHTFGRENFITAMNEQAKAWDLNGTYFKDPTGISVSNQSTVRDLKKLSEKIYENYPKIFELTRKAKISIRDLSTNRVFKFDNNNTLAGRADFLGGKTGHTDEAQGNLISIFAYGRRPVGVIILGTDDRFGETESLFNWFKSSYRY